jgi:hypothetical protein
VLWGASASMLQRRFTWALVAFAVPRGALVAGKEEDGKADFFDLKCSACCSSKRVTRHARTTLIYSVRKAA